MHTGGGGGPVLLQRDEEIKKKKGKKKKSPKNSPDVRVPVGKKSERVSQLSSAGHKV